MTMNSAKRKRNRVAGLSLLAVTGLFSTYMQTLRGSSAYAATSCTVTVGTDSVATPAPGSLRACVDSIESGGTITFSVPSVTLVSDIVTNGVSFALDGGTNGVTINGGGDSSGFRMLKANLADETLTMSNVTLQGFNGLSYGSVVYISGNNATLDLNDVTIKSNSGSDGTIYFYDDATATITNSNFTDNTSSSGGGALDFRVRADLTITDSSFTDNTSEGDGGAVNVESGVVTISGSEFTGNSADGNGGALLVNTGTSVTVTDSTFTDNSAGDFGYSGAIAANAGTALVVTNSRFDGNSAYAIGAINGALSTTITNSTFVGNTAYYYTLVAGDLTLTNVTMTGNTSSYAPMVEAYGNMALNFTTIAANSAEVEVALGKANQVLTTNASVISSPTGAACRLGDTGTAVDTFTVASDSTCGLSGVGSVNSATAPQLALGAPQVVKVAGVDQTVIPMSAASILVTGAPSTDLTTGVTTDQVGAPRGVAPYGYTIGARQFAPAPDPVAPLSPMRPGIAPGNGEVRVSVDRRPSGDAPSRFVVTALPGGRTCGFVSTTGGSCTVKGLKNGGRYRFTAVAVNPSGRSAPSGASETAQPGPVKRPSAQTVTRRLPLGESALTVGRVSAQMMVEANAGSNGLDIAGPSFTMAMHGLDAQGRRMSLGREGVLALVSSGKVGTSGVGFLPGSSVNVYFDPVVGAASGSETKAIFVGTAKVRANGTFSLTAAMPKGLTRGLHDIQAVGVSRGNLLRAVTLGVSVANRPI
ncbi:MAG: right-handed parallel beta-helix repeat-containing protein [Actinobacteria bacterium]|nr:right-handed parallel beta-helix repeat-containing protein [Actinomycetota bacterium]